MYRVDVVECVEEVASELQPHSLGDWEVLLQTQIDIHIAGPDYRSLRRTSSEYVGRIGIWGWVEPLISGECAAAWVEVLPPSEGFTGAGAAIRA